jgi:hypothetical protein
MPSRRRYDDDDDYEDGRPGRRGEEQTGLSPVMMVGTLGGLVAFLVVVVVLIAVVKSHNRDRVEDDPQANNNPGMAVDPPNPIPNLPPNPKQGGESGAGPGFVRPPETLKPPREGAKPFPPVPPLADGLVESANLIGGKEATEKFREFRTDGSVLIGFEVGSGPRDGERVISYLRPIYRTSDGNEEFGTAYGSTTDRIVTLKAVEGYALGAVRMAGRVGGAFSRMQCVFLRVLPNSLDENDQYEGNWSDNQRPQPPKLPTPGTRPLKPVDRVVGIHGRRFEDVGGTDARDNGSIEALAFVTVPVKSSAVPASATGTPSATPGNPADTTVLNPVSQPNPWSEQSVPRPLPDGWRQSKVLGLTSTDAEFSDFRTDGSILIGFEVGTNERAIVSYLRPIWLTPGGVEEFGTAYGKKSATVTTLKAKDGYAVSGIMVSKGGHNFLDGFSLLYTKKVPKKGLSTNKKDVYVGEWVGEPSRKATAETVSTSGGFPIVGFSGPCDLHDGGMIRGMGLTVPNKLDGWQVPVPALAKSPEGKPKNTNLQGHSGGLDFIDQAPPGGWLVGLEVSTGRADDFDVVIAIRPMYQTQDRPSDGHNHGFPAKPLVRLVAKQGYAVGAITVKSGRYINGLSVTFMKVTAEGQLNPKDSYESVWVGGIGGGEKVTLGDGTPVVGIAGRMEGPRTVAVGLLLANSAGK